MPKKGNSNNDNDDFAMDETQFKKMLHTMFPNTKNLSSKITEMDAIEKKINKERKIEEVENSSSEDSDSESDSDDSEYSDLENQAINIIVTMGNINDFNEYSDSEYDSDSDQSELSEKHWETCSSSDEENDKTYVPKKKIKQRKSPVVTRSKTKVSSEPNDESKDKVTPPKSESNKYSILLNSLMEKIKDTPDDDDIESKINTEMKEFIKKEKAEIETIQKEKTEKEEKKHKLKNEKKFKKILHKNKNMNSMEYFKKQTVETQKSSLTQFEEIENYSKVEKPYSFIIIESDLPIAYKTIALKKLKMFENMEPGASDYYKNKMWVDTFMEIPFSKYATLPVTLETSSQEDIISFMEMSMKTLDNVVYGMDDAKMQIMQIIGKWIANPECVGNSFAINGPPGTGKTTLIKDGISKILNRPFAFIPLGGATDSSYLEGHSYTYEGSIWGKIVQIIIDSKVMNPVIYFDELDKVSNSPRGEEIIGILTHLTDTSQNSQFHDKYFSGIDFDLSKALFIFSYNDESKINPILKDRMYRINTKGYNNNDKQIISNKYILPSILKSIHFTNDDIIIGSEVTDYINQNLTENEKGVRNMKRCLETICSKLNLIRLSHNTKILGDDIDIPFKIPYTVSIDDVRKLIKVNPLDIPINMYT